MMTATRSFDASLSLVLKQEKDEEDDDEDDEDDDDEDSNSASSLAQPSILNKDDFEFIDPRNEFLRLTSMVRRVYFSYLHKSILANYGLCSQLKDKEVTKSDLKKFASQMELYAVKASLEASLYRQTMLKMISDVKSSTANNKIHKKLTIFLEKPPTRVNVAVQTIADDFQESKINNSLDLDKEANTRNAFVISNFDHTIKNEPDAEVQKNLDDRILQLLTTDKMKSSPKEESGVESEVLNSVTDNMKKKSEVISVPSSIDDKKQKACYSRASFEEKALERAVNESQHSRDRIENDVRDIFGNEDTMENQSRIEEDDASQDSLMQNLEDMFCESDDSSDLMTLIEKHSGVTKAKVDFEITKMCPEEEPPPAPRRQLPEKHPEVRTESTVATNKRKLTFGSYKKMKKRAMGEPETPPHEETVEERHERKVRGIWFVERVHQVTKLETRMMELSMNNYRKHGRLCAKFVELFGEPDEEDAIPQSPIRIEEHLTACKERIAPWVVKHLMPYYTKKIIANRLLFKAVAKHVVDMLIIENTFPEEDCVAAHIEGYFRNKSSIKAESDIYM